MSRIINSIRAKIVLLFISIVCFSCMISFGIVVMINFSFMGIDIKSDDIGQNIILGITLLICAIISSILMFFATNFITNPIKQISNITKEVAKGNFDVRIDYRDNDEIGVLSRNFNLMAEELKNMEYLRKDFMSNVSHEFKTPIASIQGFVEIIKDKNLSDEKFDEYTDIIIEETKRLTNLSSNILRLSKLDNQIIQNNKSKFYLDEQIRKSILLLEDSWSKKNIELDINLQKINYEGYEELIEQIWINLISNAVKFSYEYGTISLTLKQDSKFIVVEIQDEGSGISEESKERIYEKFYQGDTSRSEEGNGLGLAIVKRIIEICQGSIFFDSNLEKGTKFTVMLPK